MSQTPPDPLPLPGTWRKTPISKRLRDGKRALDLLGLLKGLGDDLPEAIELFSGAATTVLDRWFESDELKGTLATDAIIGTFQPPSALGTAYVLLHHVMGSSGGARGVWGYVRGGMGNLSHALAESAKAHGVEISTGTGVQQIVVENGRVQGIPAR